MRPADLLLGLTTRAAALCVVVMALALLLVLAHAAAPSVRQFGMGFIAGSEWRPNELERPARDASGQVLVEDGETVMETVPAAFGALPVLYGTAASAALALALAFPLGVLTALFLVRLGAGFRPARVVSYFVEVLAAIPSIAFGMWGLFVLAPLIGRNLLCGGVLLGIMILPIVTAVSREVLRAVPASLLEGSIALGATWWQTSWTMVRESRSGLTGAALLGFGRAAGETMAVAMVIGNATRISLNPLDPSQTMASLLANEFAEAGTELHRAALLEVALLLLALSLLTNMAARLLVREVRA